jgi:hypothetical protein
LTGTVCVGCNLSVVVSVKAIETMDLREWVRDYQTKARAAGDQERQRLLLTYTEAYPHYETDPDRALALLDRGRLLARKLGEPGWVLFFDFWRTEVLLHHKMDYTYLLDHAVRTALEARKPLYAQHPLRFAVLGHLAAAYLYTDPRGYAAEIREALAHLQAELPDIREEHYVLVARQCLFAEALGRLHEAIALGEQGQSMLEGDPNPENALHHRVGGYRALCRLYFRRGDWQALGEAAAAGEEAARKKQAKKPLAEVLLWRAVWLRHEGDAEEAQRLCRRATSLMGRLGARPTENFFAALAAYHEWAGNLAAALRVRGRQLEQTVGRGMTAAECECRIERCRLLARLGRPLDDEMAAARQAAGRSRASDFYLGRLDRIAAGEAASGV